MNSLHRWYCRSSHWDRTIATIMPWALDNVSFGDQVLEVGPGPGMSTAWLRRQCKRLTCLEIDPALARGLVDRFAEQNVDVTCGDASRMPFEDCSFSSAVCFTMLHHVPSAELQDLFFAEVHRVLQPGGTFAGTDSIASLRMRLFHVFDTMVLVDPGSLPARLEAAGFVDVSVETGRERFRFSGRRRS